VHSSSKMSDRGVIVYDGSGYAPQYVEQPLCYVLPFVVWRYVDRRGFLDGLSDWWHDRDDKFHEAINQIERKRRIESEGFYVIQGQHLLTREC